MLRGMLKKQRKTNKENNNLQTRLNLIGCTKPNSFTVRRLTAMHVLVHCKVLPNAKRRYEKFKGLEDAVRRGRKPWPFDTIQEYPECITQLPLEVLEHAYGEDKPITMVCLGLHLVDPQIPMRRFVN